VATPTLGNTPTDIGTNSDADVLTGWTITSGAVDTDLKKEGSGSVFGILRNDLSVGYYDVVVDGGAATDMTGEHVRMFIWFNSVGLLDIEANGGMEFYMYDGTNTAYWVAFGGDTYEGGWFNLVLDCDSSPHSGSFDKTIVERWGFRYNRTAAPRNVDNTWLDYLRYGDGYYATGGTSGDEIDLAGIQGVDATNGYGILELIDGVYFSRGDIQIGNGATTTWFEMLGEVLMFVDAPVASTLYSVRGEGTGCRVNIENSVLKAADAAIWTLDMDDADIVTCSITGSFIVTGGGAVAFKSGQTITGNVFDGCGVITAGGADLDNSKVSGYEGTTDTSALNWDLATDPDDYLTGMTFTKGTAATHAIEFGTSIPSEITLTNIAFSGYNVSDDQTDSTLLFADTSGTITLNLVNCTGNISIDDTAGCTVVPVIDPVTTEITVIDSVTKAVVENARVRLVASDGTGALPFEDSITSINRSGAVATVVTPAAHGLVTDDIAQIEGATEDEYNGAFAVTYISSTSFSYTVPGTPSTPAGGTKTVTGGYFNELTSASGIVTDTRSLTSNQPMTGWVRKGSASPYYQTSNLDFTVDSGTGYTTTVQFIPDE